MYLCIVNQTWEHIHFRDLKLTQNIFRFTYMYIPFLSMMYYSEVSPIELMRFADFCSLFLFLFLLLLVFIKTQNIENNPLEELSYLNQTKEVCLFSMISVIHLDTYTYYLFKICKYCFFWLKTLRMLYTCWLCLGSVWQALLCTSKIFALD